MAEHKRVGIITVDHMKLNHSSPEIFFNQQTEMCANTEDTSTKNIKHQTNWEKQFVY